MKKSAFIFISILLSGCIFSNDTFAQKGPMDPMSKDSWTLNFGFGPGIHFYTAYAAGFGPGLQVAFEKGMWQLGPGVLTLGAEMGFSYFTYSGNYGTYYSHGRYYDLGYKYHWLNFIMAARAAYHYGWRVTGLDTYGGLATGLRFLSFSHTYSDYYNGDYGYYSPATVGFFPGIFFGASYFFTPIIGVNAEFGYNITYAQIGLNFKLK